ncbi:MAG: S1C family serine protease [Pirellula sp.]
MKYGIDKLLLLTCFSLWGGMLTERTFRQRDPRCLDGSCNPTSPVLKLPTSVDTDPRSRSFESLEDSDLDELVPEPKTSDELGGYPIQPSKDSNPRRLVQQETRQQGAQGRGRENRFSSSRGHQRSQYATLRAFREAIGDHWKSTVQIFGENRQLALGAIARADGWIVTKSSEIPDQSIEIRLHDGTKLSGLVKIRRPELDLAMIKIDRDNLPAILWDTQAVVPLGGWVASADSRSLPLALGVVSVEKRNIQQQRALLGIQLSSVHQGPLVDNVVVGSGADQAGIRQGDIIVKIEGKEVETRQAVLNLLMTLQAGKKITIDVNRDSKAISFEAQMMDLTNVMLDPTELEVNGRISARSTGFREVVEHDSVLEPQHCGGPIIDVDGNVVGLNIARAGRVSCYALRAITVSNAIDEMLQNALKTHEPIVASEKASIEKPTSDVIPASVQTPEAPVEVGSGLKVDALKPPTNRSP